MRNPARRLAALLFLVLAAGGCGKKKDAPPAQQRDLKIAIDNPIPTLDPTFTEGTTFAVLSNVFEPLVDYDKSLKLIPALAVEWNAPDEKTWVLKLRPGVTLHDGTKLSAEDCAAALRRAKDDPISELRGRLSAIDVVEAPDASTLQIRTSRPDALLLHALTNVLVGKGASRAEVEKQPIGSGPYRVAHWDKSGNTELERFTSYWNGPAQIPRVVFTPVPLEARAAALKEKRLDVGVVPAQAVPIRQRGFRIASSNGLTTFYLFISTLAAAGADNPMRDRAVRQAMSLAVDRHAIAKKAVGHDGAFAPQLVPISVFGFSPELRPPPFEPSAARALLVKSGRRLPVKLTLAHREGPEMLAVAQAAKAMLDDVGFETTLRSMSWTDLLAGVSAQKIPLALSRWRFDNGDAGSFLRDCLRSRHPGSADGTYNAGYSSPEMDALIDASTMEFDSAKRLKAFEQVASLAQEDVPLIPLFNQPDVWGVASDLAWEARVDGRMLVYEMAVKAASPSASPAGPPSARP